MSHEGLKTNKKLNQLAAKTFCSVIMGTLILGCNQNPKNDEPAAVAATSAVEETAITKYNVNKYPMNKVVCNPWDPTPAESPEYGLKASLFYRSSTQPRYYSAFDYVGKTTASNQSLFFKDLNVPARVFSDGFATQSSEAVKDDLGNLLIEYFGLKFETNLVLGPNDPAGLYELATLADDGVVVQALINGIWTDIVNSDGDHSVKMGCSTRYLDLTRQNEIPLKVFYYQGPRYHIANVLMWRHVPDATKNIASIECNKKGTKYFFDAENNSKPLAAYDRVFSEGFRPIRHENFKIPDFVGYNPCVQGLAPVISAFGVLEIQNTAVSIKWETDILATSQVKVTEVDTGTVSITDSDGVARKNHIVKIVNLKPNTKYKIQALSISLDLGKSLSPEIEVTTEE